MHLPAGHQAGCGCPACGLALREIGQDVSEVLDYEPGSFHVVRHVRPKLACSGCKDILQAAAPSRPIERVMAGAGMLAHVLVGKYCRPPCATSTITSVVRGGSWCFIEDEGGPLGVGLQEQAPNHLKLLG